MPQLVWKRRANLLQPAHDCPAPSADVHRRGDDPPAFSRPLPVEAVDRFCGYFETQVQARCGMHALNNALGCSFVSVHDLEAACQELLLTNAREGLQEHRSQHIKPGGWYSIEILAQALQQAAMEHYGRVEYQMCLEPLCLNSGLLRTAVGALVNIDNAHWIALRWIADKVWFLDSQASTPRLLTWAEYVHFVSLHRCAYCINVAQQI